MTEHQDNKKDFLIYMGIILATAVIVGIHYLNLGLLGTVLIIAIAVTEAVIVAYHFMHLMTKKKTIHLILLLTIITFITLLVWPAWDIADSPRSKSDYVINH